MGRHDSEIMDDGRFDRDAGALGVVAAGGKAADPELACWRYVPGGTRSVSAAKQANVAAFHRPQSRWP
ncbi:hypothetical protein BQ8482_100038 [Mesorhizobium delmotii]|uniref:Uncharacterized protein n=1 Tax=Mesorhizobium delmotii TaxID=1631247 RepID=A0A2P9A9P1_9HYPH|nr:hypothetical protein BQ8482_100038 [Mesorhizobium delmotii]